MILLWLTWKGIQVLLLCMSLWRESRLLVYRIFPITYIHSLTWIPFCVAPHVTLVGVGIGSRVRIPGGGCATRGRDMGTARVMAPTTGLWRWGGNKDTCGANDLMYNVDYIRTEPAGQRDVYVDRGDSGSPMLIGVGNGVGHGQQLPTAFIEDAGLGQDRYVVGVASWSWFGLIP